MNEEFKKWCEERGWDPKVARKIKCIGCDMTLEEIWKEDPTSVKEHFLLDSEDEYEPAYSEYDGQILCYACYESETNYPVATISRNNRFLLRLFDHFYFINIDEISDDEEEGILHELAEELHKAIKWVRTDPWRGYYDLDKKKLKKWAVIHEDVVLSGSEDAENLKKYEEALIKILNGHHVYWVRVLLTTSNLFSSGYYLLAYRRDMTPGTWLMLMNIAITLRKVLRRDEDFIVTALTGTSNPEHRKLFLKAYKKLMKGEPIEKILKDISKEMDKGG